MIMKKDVHGCELIEAMDEISLALEECKLTGDSHLEIVHGYKHGQVLKTYFQSAKFISQMAREGFKLKRLHSPDPAISTFKIL